jgi:pre-mRNA-processing factor SLU7
LLPKVATKFRKGACENCGALTHAKKDCLERPRKIGAKYSGTNIAPDELPQPDIEFGFDGKRDRWNGYDPNDYLAVVDEFQKVCVCVLFDGSDVSCM